jgi:hypothetical protein
MTFASLYLLIQIHDRQVARPQKLHGRPPVAGLSASSSRNRKIMRIPRGIQAQVPSRFIIDSDKSREDSWIDIPMRFRSKS